MGAAVGGAPGRSPDRHLRGGVGGDRHLRGGGGGGESGSSSDDHRGGGGGKSPGCGDLTAKPAVTELGLVFVGPPLVALKGAERPQTVCIGCNTERADRELGRFSNDHWHDCNLA